jgi:hypothetical protein
MEHEMLVMLASLMTKDQIIDKIEESISEYKEATLIGNEEEINIKAHHLAMSCNLFMMNMVTDGNMEGAMETIKKIMRLRDREKIFDVNGNKRN